MGISSVYTNGPLFILCGTNFTDNLVFSLYVSCSDIPETGS